MSVQNAFNNAAAWASRFATALENKSPGSRLAVVNFAGVPEKVNYKAGSNGLCSHSATSGLVHYKVEVAPGTAVTSAGSKISKMAALDGNSQLWLCLQDVSISPFTNNLKRANRTVESADKITNFVYQTEVVIVTDDDWDLKGDRLRTAQGAAATEASVSALLHSTYDRVSMIVCRERDSNHNEAKINALCKGRNTYNKVASSTFDADFDAATARILA